MENSREPTQDGRGASASAQSGGCLCGAVRYRIGGEYARFDACHCHMCRRWSGGVAMAMQVKEADISLTGAENLTHYTSSDWAERVFCKICGSGLYYRMTAPGPMSGQFSICAGTLDDYGDLEFDVEIFTDRKLKNYAFAGERKQMTEAEVIAMFAGEGDGA